MATMQSYRHSRMPALAKARGGEPSGSNGHRALIENHAVRPSFRKQPDRSTGPLTYVRGSETESPRLSLRAANNAASLALHGVNKRFERLSAEGGDARVLFGERAHRRGTSIVTRVDDTPGREVVKDVRDRMPETSDRFMPGRGAAHRADHERVSREQM